jgi:PKD repeat protein
MGEEKNVIKRVTLVSVFFILFILLSIIFFAGLFDWDRSNDQDERTPPLYEKSYTFDLMIQNRTPNIVHIQFEGFETPHSWNGTHMIDYGDGNISGWVTTKTLAHRYEILQEYTLKLFATPHNNSFKFVVKRIIDLSEVGRIRPIAVIKDTNPSYYMSEQPVMLSGDGSYDIDGDVIGYYWDFGDGYHSDLATGVRDGYQRTKVASHDYDSPGDYRVKLWVMDNDFNTSIEPGEIRVRIMSSQTIPCIE